MIGLIPLAPGPLTMTGFQVHQNLTEPLYRNAWLHSDPKDGAGGVLYLVPQAGGGLARFTVKFKSANGRLLRLKHVRLECLLATNQGATDGLIALTVAGDGFELPECSARGFGPVQFALDSELPKTPMSLPAEPVESFELRIGLADSNGGQPQVALKKLDVVVE